MTDESVLLCQATVDWQAANGPNEGKRIGQKLASLKRLTRP